MILKVWEIKTGKLNVKIRDDIDSKFRERVFRRKGMKKGNITEAVEEAILLWVNTPNHKVTNDEKDK